jgi:hypothetical protein
MIEKSYNHLKKLLKELKNNQGHFIIESGDFYCQLMKEKKDGYILFEAVSHYNNKIVNQGIESELKKIGFNLPKNENYNKNIFLNSQADIEATAKEIDLIFENIYKISNTANIQFDDQIEAVSKQTYVANQKTNLDSKTRANNVSLGTWVLLICIGIAVYAVLFNKSGNETKKDAIYNSEWDSSVKEVVDFIKNKYLKDPDSYQSISWSSVFKLNDTKAVGFASYQVRHKFRAKNSFGGYVVEEKMFKLDYQGNIVDIKDWVHSSF